MATRAQRWRGPRRPDVAELRSTVNGSQSARGAQETQQSLAATQQYSDQAQQQHQYEQTTQRRTARTQEPASAVSHFKFGFLSAGRPAPSNLSSSSSGFGASSSASAASTTASATGAAGDAPLSFVNRRSNIMDATRSFEDAVPLSAAEKTARAVAVSQREHQAAGMGYGDLHPGHYAYLSKELPAKSAPGFFDERPCVFPLHELPPLEQRPAADLLTLEYNQQQQHSQQFKRKIASHLGYGVKKPGYFAYQANTYWREGSTTQRPAGAQTTR